MEKSNMKERGDQAIYGGFPPCARAAFLWVIPRRLSKDTFNRRQGIDGSGHAVA